MAAKRSGLGKGLDSLFLDNTAGENSSGAVKINIDDIEPNRNQPRKVFDEKALGELSESIKQYGVIQPLLVRPMPDGSYQIVAGERRWRAAKEAGLTELPVTIREMSDDEAAALALIENLQREDLNPIEEALGLSQLIDNYGLTQEEASLRVGKSRPAIANSLRLLNLPEDIRNMVEDGKLSAGHSRALLSFSDEKEMRRVADMIVNDGISVRDVEKLSKAASTKKRKTKKALIRDTYYDMVELSLSDTLKRKVKIHLAKGGRGTLEIEFFDTEDLKKIANELGKE